MNISLGPPYEVAIQRIIGKGYAGNQTEVIRQAILALSECSRKRNSCSYTGQLREKYVRLRLKRLKIPLL